MAAETASDRLVSRQEAARLANVHVNTIRLWEASERVHPVKQENGRVLIPLSELEAVVRERQSNGPNEHDRMVELEIENRALRAEVTLVREALEQLRKDHEEVLRTVIDLARKGGEGRS